MDSMPPSRSRLPRDPDLEELNIPNDKRRPEPRRAETDDSHTSGRAWAREATADPWEPCILTLDGGGVRSYSSLLVLKELMHEVWLWEHRLETAESTGWSAHGAELLPCHYFDFIYGTSGGGVIATLLGRLRMTVSDAIDEYLMLSNAMFGSASLKSILPFATRYHSQPLELALEALTSRRSQIYKKSQSYSDEAAQQSSTCFDPRLPRICQTCCLAATEEKISEAYLLRTFPIYYSDTPSWLTPYNEGASTLSIRQVLRATTATPFYFNPVTLEDEDGPQTLRDGGVRENNPSSAALSDFHALYDDSGCESPAVLLSLGTGQGNSSQEGLMTWPGKGVMGRVPFLRGLFQRVTVLENLLLKYTDGDNAHQRMREYARGEHTWYKRLNVDGLDDLQLDDWRKGDFHGKRLVDGGATLDHIELAINEYLIRDFNPEVDDYAPPSTMLRQVAEKLVRQRRARQKLGGDRWFAFIDSKPPADVSSYSTDIASNFPAEDSAYPSTFHAVDKGPAEDTTVAATPCNDFSAIDIFDDLGAILDPVNYNASLNTMQERIADIRTRDPVMELGLPKSRPVAWTTCRTSVEATLRSIRLMQADDFLRDHLHILVVDDNRSDVIQVACVPVSDIERLRDFLDGDMPAKHVRNESTELVQRLLRMHGALKSLNPVLSSMGHDLMPLRTLCKCLAYATISYSQSHCFPPSNLRGSTYQPDQSSYMIDEHGLCFYQRHLRCLEHFLGRTVWVFGYSSVDSNKKALLSTTIKQFADLWGPLYTIPKDDQSDEILALQTEGGIIYKSEDVDKSQVSGEVLCHWIAAGPLHTKGSSKRPLLRGDVPLPSTLLPFKPTARLLIGSGEASTVSSTLIANEAEERMLSLPTHLRPLHGLSENVRCTLNQESFRIENDSSFRVLGAHESYHAPDGFDVGFSAGQYIGVSSKRAYKPKPGVTHKNRLVDICSRPQLKAAQLMNILQLYVGLEMSACTKNGRRSSLCDTIALAFPQDKAVVESVMDFTKDDSATRLQLTGLLVDLQLTGIDHTGTLQLMWPFGSGLPEAFRLEHPKPRWSKMLKDTPVSSCFAVLSMPCLTFKAIDEVEGHNIKKTCCARFPGLQQRTVLSTRILLDPTMAVHTSGSALHARLKLQKGVLAVRNESIPQMMFFESDRKVRNMLNDLSKFALARLFIHREAIDGSRNESHALPVLILDED